MILFLDQSGQIGGAEICLADLAGFFQSRSRVILLSDGPFFPYLQARGIPVSVLPLPGNLSRATKKRLGAGVLWALPAFGGLLWKLRKAILSSKVVYLNTAKALLVGTAANVPVRRLCLFHLHDLWDAAHFSRSNIRLLVAAANRADAIIANSRASADAFRKAGGKTALHVIPNGFDSRRFDAVDAGTVAALRVQWNPSGGPVAAIFGRLSRWKGQHVLIEAARQIPGLTVWIVGEALYTEDDAAYAAELKALAAGLGARVQFLGFQGNVPGLMLAADIIVHTSISPEPFGRVIVEGMLAGKPVIAVNAGGPREIIRPDVTGLLIPPGDSSALAAALKNLLANPQAARAMGEAGRRMATVEYSLERVGADTQAILRRLETP
ncbi:MAG: glycosyltransferase family 4 protein [Chthoniobacterales bacterium]|nr:glycosyltransferase family 4 protein [Chthoniobacterales bacterium]